jgi:uroporphyrinogen-III synthase
LIALPAMTVGDNSAEAARAVGFVDVTSAAGDGRDLVRRAGARFIGSVRPLLYLAGEDRARDLAGELGAFGLAVHTAVVYRAVAATGFPPTVRAALFSGGLDGVVHFSRRSVENYLACADGMLDRALQPAHFCLSARAAEPLKAAGAAAIHVATRPDEAALLAMVTPRP